MNATETSRPESSPAQSREAAPEACCSTSEQASCCEPSAKAGCCGAPAGESAKAPSSCGCR